MCLGIGEMWIFDFIDWFFSVWLEYLEFGVINFLVICIIIVMVREWFIYKRCYKEC